MNTELLKARQTQYVAYVTVYVLVVLTAVVIANFLANRYTSPMTRPRTNATAFRTDRQNREGSEAARDHHLFRPVHPLPARQRSAGRVFESFAQRFTWIMWTRIRIRRQRAKPESRITEPPSCRLGPKRRSQELHRRGHHRARSSATLKTHDAHGLLCDRQRRTPDRRFRPQRLFPLQRLARRKTTMRPSRLICCEKAEVPGDCTVMVVGGPTHDYQQPEVDAIKKYVEDGGRALFMLDPPLKIGRSMICRQRCAHQSAAELGRDRCRKT